MDEISSNTVDEPTSVYFPTEANAFRRFKRVLVSRFKGIIITKKGTNETKVARPQG